MFAQQVYQTTANVFHQKVGAALALGWKTFFLYSKEILHFFKVSIIFFSILLNASCTCKYQLIANASCECQMPVGVYFKCQLRVSNASWHGIWRRP